MEFLFRDRGSGKRQVKPSQEIALLEDQLAGGESSDDEDFTLPEKGKNSVENSDNASSGTTKNCPQNWTVLAEKELIAGF